MLPNEMTMKWEKKDDKEKGKKKRMEKARAVGTGEVIEKEGEIAERMKDLSQKGTFDLSQFMK